jgi:hypothetical protein
MWVANSHWNNPIEVPFLINSLSLRNSAVINSLSLRNKLSLRYWTPSHMI